MPYPAGVITRTVAGTLAGFPAAPSEAIFKSRRFVVSPTDTLILAPIAETVVPGAEGLITVELPVTDDPQYKEPGWTYDVTLRFGDHELKGTLAVPIATVGTLNLAAALILHQPAEPGAADYLTAADLGAPGRAASLDPNGRVPAAQLPAGNGGTVQWDDIVGAPTVWPPAPHHHDDRYLTEQETAAALAAKADTADLAPVATSGSYHDLTDRPTIPATSVVSVNGKTGAVTIGAADVGADPAGAAAATLGVHAGDTTDVHGIADTSALVVTSDSRLSDARTPTAHAASHGSVGSDPVAVNASQITGGTLPAVRGGTGLTSFTPGTFVTASASNTLTTGKAVPAGAVVGTIDEQTLTNKTLTAPAIIAPTGLVKADVGLDNVNNTADADKPVSTAQAAALAGKADSADLASLAARVVEVENMTPLVLMWDGTAYVESPLARVYVGPVNPGSAPNGSVWVDTTP